eukprot:5809168-Pleurochrysis_carterae.AAC.2
MASACRTDGSQSTSASRSASSCIASHALSSDAREMGTRSSSDTKPKNARRSSSSPSGDASADLDCAAAAAAALCTPVAVVLLHADDCS